MVDLWVYLVEDKTRGVVVGVLATRHEAAIVAMQYANTKITPWFVESQLHEQYKASD